MDATSRQLLLGQLQAVFGSPADAQDALAALDAYRGPGGDDLKQTAIKASGGKLRKLRELLQAAKKDFRDVYLQAQSPETVLRNREARRADPTLHWGGRWVRTVGSKRKKKSKRAMSRTVYHRRDGTHVPLK